MVSGIARLACPEHFVVLFSDTAPLELHGPCGRADCVSAACRCEAGVVDEVELDADDFVIEVDFDIAA